MSETDPLTLERMRGDVASMLGEDADAIALDDNLLDLGLDSMRMLGLVMAWGRTGIALEFSDLAEFATLGDWWQVVQRLQAQGPAATR